MQVRWSTTAADDLARIFRRIEKDNPSAARETVRRIYDGCAALKDFPYRGRPGRMNGRRELIFAPYIAVYQIKEKGVEISRIITQERHCQRCDVGHHFPLFWLLQSPSGRFPERSASALQTKQ